MSDKDGRATNHQLEVNIRRGDRQNPSWEFAVAGLALASKWELPNGNIRRVEEVNIQKSTEMGVTLRQPRVVFEYGPTWTAGQFIHKVKNRSLKPETPAAFSLSSLLRSPPAKDGDSDGE
jgi:hypothetical protein